MALLLVGLIAVLVTADQIIKYWAVNTLMPVGTMDFIHIGDLKILDLTYLENTGAIFGSMSGQRWFLVGFTSLVIIGGIIFMFMTAKKSKFLSTTVSLFVAGGIGNLIDRMRFGYVVDMFEIKLFRFAIFNFADICVTIAFVLMLVYVIFVEPKKSKTEKGAENNE
ncbi:MAG: signal peptidase II [Ruminococcus sp.]|nr:signal peptidase II [Ruminococcus sp.]